MPARGVSIPVPPENIVGLRLSVDEEMPGVRIVAGTSNSNRIDYPQQRRNQNENSSVYILFTRFSGDQFIFTAK
jgi:hypothetical protein